MRNVLMRLVRALAALRRPSKRGNLRRLRDRGEDLATDFVVREPTLDDVPALAHLHAVTWAATYPGVRRPPTAELRAHQWRERFARTDELWFAFVVQRRDGALVGFAQGNAYAHPDQPHYAGQLNKIYLLGEYQRLGLGRRLMGHVARRFLEHGIGSMLCFADAGNPSCAFYESLGGELLRDAGGTPTPGNYGWRDLRRLSESLSAE
jgi:ribosomal protein S18 acetylase RimI-like enzyme